MEIIFDITKYEEAVKEIKDQKLKKFIQKILIDKSINDMYIFM